MDICQAILVQPLPEKGIIPYLSRNRMAKVSLLQPSMKMIRYTTIQGVLFFLDLSNRNRGIYFVDPCSGS